MAEMAPRIADAPPQLVQVEDLVAIGRELRSQGDNTVASTRTRLGSSQIRFAELLGISVKTLHNWEQGRRQPTGAARVLLRVAARHPEVILEAAVA
jgi:DNA-binding transcriptional regulator YiaG